MSDSQKPRQVIIGPGTSTAKHEQRLSDAQVEQLIRASQEARSMAYCPYSKFSVGAALLTKDGQKVFKGCNVENASYGMTICAERGAIMSAVVQGHRQFQAVAITADMGETFVGPCGACRQVLAEFGLGLEIYLSKPNLEYMVTTIDALLPDAFIWGSS
ncbi:cytidine deaminase-like isoform X2 [Oratosquilla oratoria]|uniref:cytidine deaminase-like isoform X2 n=1 Tax=Oratosquilla oratoria TaxID=337810 RepID=UPI003F75A932